MNQTLNRRGFLRLGGAAVGAAAIAIPALDLIVAKAAEFPGLTVSGPPSSLAGIYQLQAAFHRAKTFQDLDLMASLWAEDATFHVGGVSIVGRANIKAWFSTSGSFTHHRVSLVPSFRDRIDANGDSGFLYFECHDVDKATGALVTHLSQFGTVRKVADQWLFQDMTAGVSAL